MDAIKAITERVSIPQLTGDSIAKEQQELLFKAALRAPDHAWLRPSRYLTIEGGARAQLGDIFVATYPGAESLSEEKQTKMRNMLLRAPLVLVAITQIHDHPKVPRDEQILSTGAGIQNILNTAHALGLGAIWRTGDMAHSDGVKQALGLADNELITGFVYIGLPNTAPKPIPDLNITDYVQAWSPKTE